MTSISYSEISDSDSDSSGSDFETPVRKRKQSGGDTSKSRIFEFDELDAKTKEVIFYMLHSKMK